MKPPTRPVLQRAFARKEPPNLLAPGRACAAVAIVFRTAATQSGPADLELCFVRRAPFPGDPWSGDMAFPGGKGEGTDQSFHDIAARETFEETGLEITLEHYLGSLPPVQVRPSSRIPNLLLKPQVYWHESASSQFTLSHEIAEAYWIPVANLWDPSRLTTVDWGKLPQDYPGIRHQKYVIWGLTYRILGDLADRLAHPLPEA